MIRPQDLLSHAVNLVRSGTEADTRRAVSATYYALFHTLTADGSAFFASAGSRAVARAARSFEHSTMRRVCDGYFRPSPARAADNRLARVARAFVVLQDARRSADYDLETIFDHVEGERLVGLGAAAIQTWSEIRQETASQDFLATLLLGDRTRRG